jgi:hypothetical protein
VGCEPLTGLWQSGVSLSSVLGAGGLAGLYGIAGYLLCGDVNKKRGALPCVASSASAYVCYALFGVLLRGLRVCGGCGGASPAATAV